jgi:hypothetical protein
MIGSLQPALGTIVVRSQSSKAVRSENSLLVAPQVDLPVGLTVQDSTYGAHLIALYLGHANMCTRCVCSEHSNVSPERLCVCG